MIEQSRAGGAGPRPRALFVSADLPWPPDGGGRIATLRNLEGIARLYETDLVALADPVGEPDTSELERLCRRVTVIRKPFTFGRHRLRQGAEAFRSLFSTEPYRLRKFHSDDLARALATSMAETRYDIVHFDQFGVAPYWTPDLPTSYSCQNVESDIYHLASTASRNPVTRLWSWQEGAKLRRSERRILRRFDVVLALSQEDAELLRRLGVPSIRVVPMTAPPLRPVEGPPREPVVLSLGTMSWFGVEEGLVWFRREVYPLIRERLPTARWDIVGPNAGAAIRRLDGLEGVRVRGYVDEIGPVLESARAAVVPLHIAGGVRMKLLDLMAAGVPSVSTTVGARGLTFGDGEGGFRRDDPRGFAEAVLALLTDDDLWTRTVQMGQRYLAQQHTQERFNEALESAVSSAIHTHSRHRLEPQAASSTPAVVPIADLLIHDTDADETDSMVAAWLRDPGPTARYVCTPNVDYVVRSRRDNRFRDAINAADLRVPDGMWIVYASRLAGRPLRASVTGRLLLPRLARVCRDRGRSIGIVGAAAGVAAMAAGRLEADFPGLQVRHAISPPMGFVVGSPADLEIVAALRAKPVDLLFVALGAPKQEIWMLEHRADLPGTVLIGVGAGVDIVAGRFREAPRWMTRVGFEWLFRLAQEPRRLARRYLVDDPWILMWALRTRLSGERSSNH